MWTQHRSLPPDARENDVLFAHMHWICSMRNREREGRKRSWGGGREGCESRTTNDLCAKNAPNKKTTTRNIVNRSRESCLRQGLLTESKRARRCERTKHTADTTTITTTTHTHSHTHTYTGTGAGTGTDTDTHRHRHRHRHTHTQTNTQTNTYTFFRRAPSRPCPGSTLTLQHACYTHWQR